MMIEGPLHGDWWRLLTSQFGYSNGLYEFVTLVAVAIFGWLLERRRGRPWCSRCSSAGGGGALVAGPSPPMRS